MSSIPTLTETLFLILSNTNNDSIADYLSKHPQELAFHTEPIKNVIQLHTEAALKEAAKTCTPGFGIYNGCSLTTASAILNAYPETNIK